MTGLYRTAWNIVADGTLFKGAFVLLAENDTDAVEKTKAALGREGNAATVTVKSSHASTIELGRSEYPSDGSHSTKAPHVSESFAFQPQRFIFDLAARANVIASGEDDAFKKLGHALVGKDVASVKYLKKIVTATEPIDSLSSFERHLLEKNFFGIRVSSTG